MAEKLDLIVEGVNRLQKPLKEMGEGLEKFYRQVTGQGGSISDNMSKMTTSVSGLATAFTGAGSRLGAAGAVASAAVGVFAAMAYAVGKYANSYAGLERLSKTTGLKINFIEAFKEQTEAMKIPEGLQILDSMSDFLSRLRRYDEDAIQELMKIQGPLPHELMKLIQKGGPREEQFDLIIKAMESVHNDDKNAIAAIITKRRDALDTLKAYREAQQLAPKFITTPEEHHALMEIHEKWIEIQKEWSVFMDRLNKSSAPAWLPVFENLLKIAEFMNASTQAPTSDEIDAIVRRRLRERREQREQAPGKQSALPQQQSLLNRILAALSVGSAAAAEMQQRPWTADQDVETGTYAGFRGSFRQRGGGGGGGGRRGGGGGGGGGPPELKAPTSPENAPESYADQPLLRPVESGGVTNLGGRLPTAAELSDKSIPAGERFNNPFNLQFDKYTTQLGGINSKVTLTQFDKDVSAFPSKMAGAAAAIRKMAESSLYSGKTMTDLIQQWVGHGVSYAPIIEQATGISRYTKITPEFLRSDAGILFLKTMARYETRWQRAYPLTDAEWRKARDIAFRVKGAGQGTSTGPVTVTGRTMTIEEIGMAIRRGEIGEGNQRFTRLRGNLQGVRPELVAVMKAASGDLPPGYTVEMVSGADPRSTGTANHPGRLAMDVQIRDPQGNVLSNAGFGPGMKLYEKLYQSIVLRGAVMFPNQRFIWGGGWISAAAGYGDRMHFQIVDPNVRGSSQTSGGGYDPRTGAPGSSPFAQSLMSPAEREAFRAAVRARMAGTTASGSVGVSVSVQGPSGTTVKVTPDNDVFNVHKVNRILRPQHKEQLEEAD